MMDFFSASCERSGLSDSGETRCPVVDPFQQSDLFAVPVIADEDIITAVTAAVGDVTKNGGSRKMTRAAPDALRA